MDNSCTKCGVGLTVWRIGALSVSWYGITLLFLDCAVSSFPSLSSRFGLFFGAVIIFVASASSGMDICVNCVSLTGRGLMGDLMCFLRWGDFRHLELRFRLLLLSNRLHFFFANEGLYSCRVAHDRLFGDLIVIINEFGTARSAPFGVPIVTSISLRPYMA